MRNNQPDPLFDLIMDEDLQQNLWPGKLDAYK